MSIVNPFESEIQQGRRYLRLELGRREPQDVPFASLLSYGSNGSPTITITKTLFSAAVTSTKTGGLLSAGLTGNAVTTKAAIASSTSDNVSTLTITQTTTNTRTLILTSMKTSTISTTSSSSSSPFSTLTSMRASFNSFTSLNLPHSSSRLETSNFSNALGSHTSTKSHSSTNQAHAPDSSTSGTPSGTIAGAILGSIVALGILGALFWLCCTRRKAIHETLKTKLRFGRCESAQPPTTPWLENQAMEETRTIMLQKSLSARNKSSPVISEMPDTPLRRGKSTTDSPSHPSWIGLAVSSSTPPRTPPLPRSQPQLGYTPSQPAHNVPEARLYSKISLSELGTTFQSQPEPTASAPILVPPKPVMRKPVGTTPIITNSPLPKYESTSPLSPRGMFNALGNNTKEAWKRASQVLSPGSRYSVIKKEGQCGFEFLDKDGSLKKDEAGLQESSRTESVERRGTLFGRRRSRSSTRTDNKGWTGQWI